MNTSILDSDFRLPNVVSSTGNAIHKSVVSTWASSRLKVAGTFRLSLTTNHFCFIVLTCALMFEFDYLASNVVTLVLALDGRLHVKNGAIMFCQKAHLIVEQRNPVRLNQKHKTRLV